MKKALSLMTAAALVLSLAACGSTASSAASSEAASSETASSDAASSEAASSEAASETETAELSTVEPGKLIMSTNAAFPPYEMTTDSGEFEGIDIETAQAIADKLGLELQIDDMDFDAALLAVQQGKSDMVMAGVTVTDERQNVMDFTDSYATGIQSIIVKEDSDIASVDDLAGKLKAAGIGCNAGIQAVGDLRRNGHAHIHDHIQQKLAGRGGAGIQQGFIGIAAVAGMVVNAKVGMGGILRHIVIFAKKLDAGNIHRHHKCRVKAAVKPAQLHIIIHFGDGVAA